MTTREDLYVVSSKKEPLVFVNCDGYETDSIIDAYKACYKDIKAFLDTLDTDDEPDKWTITPVSITYAVSIVG